MNDVTDSASDGVVGGTVGVRLRTAREAQGVSIDEVSQTLKFNPRQVEAMERDEFGALRDPVIMRGFVRNYARFLNLDTDSMMQQLERQVGPMHLDLTPSPSLSVPASSSKSHMTMPMAVLGVLAILGGIFALNKFAPDVIRNQQQQTKVQGTVVPNTPPPGERLAAPPPAPREEPGMPPPAATQIAAGSPAEIGRPAAEGKTDSAPSAAGGISGANVSEAAVQPAVSPGKGLKLSFEQEAWVQVKDKAGKVVHQELHKPGSQATVEIEKPFSMTIGNVGGAKVTLDGELLDLSPFTKGTVARVKLSP